LPNVGPYIYDVSISGFTRSSIYIYDISSLRVNLLPFIGTTGSGTLPHIKSASAETSRDRCGDQNGHQRNALSNGYPYVALWCFYFMCDDMFDFSNIFRKSV